MQTITGFSHQMLQLLQFYYYKLDIDKVNKFKNKLSYKKRREKTILKRKEKYFNSHKFIIPI